MTEPTSAADAAGAVAARLRVWRGYLHFDGQPVGPVPAGSGDAAQLRHQLADLLYTRWFTQSWPQPPRRPAAAPLAERLHRAHAGSRRHEPGWVALGASRGGVIATRSGVPMFVAAADVRNLTRAAGRPAPGDSLAVITPRDGVDATGAWWTAWSASPLSPLEVRVYWHCDPGYVEPLVAAITNALEDAGVPYSMKCPSHERLFGRVDAGVLYLSLAAWLQVKPALRAVHARLAPWLGDAVPPCTLRLGRGVAVAQDTGPAESFGQSRSRAVAEGIVDGLAAGAASADGIEAAILAAMTRRGISLTRPYRANQPDAADAAWRW